MKNAGKTGPAALLGELNALPADLKAKVTSAGAGIPGSLDPGAAQAGQSAALTLSQEFAGSRHSHRKGNRRNQSKYSQHRSKSGRQGHQSGHLLSLLHSRQARPNPSPSISASTIDITLSTQNQTRLTYRREYTIDTMWLVAGQIHPTFSVQSHTVTAR